MAWTSEAMRSSAGWEGTEIQLQKILNDERKKSKNHRTIYQTLKVQYISLLEEFRRLQDELKHGLAQQRELQERNRVLEALRQQVMTPQRLEFLRNQVQQEIEDLLRERFSKLEEEAEKYRSECNKLQHEHTFLKSQFDHQREEHRRVLEENRICYEAKISQLRRDKDELMVQYQGTDALRDVRRVEALLREKAQLHLRLKGLETEVAELRAQRETSGQQAENIQRIQIRQLTESQAALKSLEAERQSLRLQLERTECKLHLSHEENSQITGRLHKAEREVNSLISQIENLKHSCKQDVANIRLDWERSQGELERERDMLLGQICGLQADEEVLKGAVERHKNALREKEREMVRKVQSAREEEFSKIAALQEDKLELENHLVALKQRSAVQDAANQNQREELEGRLRSAQQGEEAVRRELQRSMRQLEDSYLEWLEEKHKLQERDVELQQKYTQINEKLQRAAVAQKKRKSQTENKEKKLKDKIHSLEAKIEELELEAAAPKTCPSQSEKQSQLKWFKELQQQTKEFWCLPVGDPANLSASPIFLTSSPNQLPCFGSEAPFPSLSEEQQQRELSVLRERLEELEFVQRQQLEELGSLVQRKEGRGAYS